MPHRMSFLYGIFWQKNKSCEALYLLKKLKAFRLFFWEEGPLGGEPNDPV